MLVILVLLFFIYTIFKTISLMCYLYKSKKYLPFSAGFLLVALAVFNTFLYIKGL